MSNWWDSSPVAIEDEKPAPSGDWWSGHSVDGETPKAPAPKPGMARSIADLGLGFASGAVGATKAIADSVGANNAVSNTLQSMDSGINAYLSPGAIADQQEQTAIMKEAEGKGLLEGVKAGGKAFWVAPLQTALTGLGSVVPVVAGMAGAALTGGAAVPIGAGIGAAMGAGSVKGSIYDTVKQRGIESGLLPADAEAAAIRAQEYGGDNTANIAGGAALGMADSLTGVTKIAGQMVKNALVKPASGAAIAGSTRGVLGRMGTGMLSEMPLEAAQGGQERYASNVALGREGYDVDPFAGVASQATLESLASAGPGAAFGAMHKARPASNAPPNIEPPPAVTPTVPDPATGAAFAPNPDGGTLERSLLTIATNTQGMPQTAIRERDFVPPPAGSFGQMNEFADLLNSERSDVESLRQDLAGRQAMRRESEFESLDARVADAMDKETAQKREDLLDSVLENLPEGQNPARAFNRALRDSGFVATDFRPEEKGRIEAWNNISKEPKQPDRILAAPNELSPDEFGIKEKPTKEQRLAANKQKFEATRSKREARLAAQARQAIIQPPTAPVQTFGNQPTSTQSLSQVATNLTLPQTIGRPLNAPSNQADEAVQTETPGQKEPTADVAPTVQDSLKVAPTAEQSSVVETPGQKEPVGGVELQQPKQLTSAERIDIAIRAKAADPESHRAVMGNPNIADKIPALQSIINGTPRDAPAQSPQQPTPTPDEWIGPKKQSISTMEWADLPPNEKRALGKAMLGKQPAPQAEQTAADANLPAVRQQLTVEFGGTRYPVDSIEDASKKWEKFRDETGEGVSNLGNGVPIFDQTGKQVAYVSYNGTVWNGAKYDKNASPLYEPTAADAPKRLTDEEYRNIGLTPEQIVRREADYETDELARQIRVESDEADFAPKETVIAAKQWAKDKGIPEGVMLDSLFDAIKKAPSFRRKLGVLAAISRDKKNAASAPKSEATKTAADAPYLKLLMLKSTTLLSSNGGRKLYAVTVSPKFRNDHFTTGRGSVPIVESPSFELKLKAAVTGNPSDNGYILIDKREENASRAPKSEATPATPTPPTNNEKLKAKRELIADMIETKRSNREKVPEAWETQLAEIDAQLRGESDASAIYSLVVEGHPMFDGQPVLRNLIPIKVTSTAGVDRKLFSAQDLYSKLAGERSQAQHALSIAKTANQENIANKALKELDSSGVTDDAVETLRNVTLPELQRLAKAAEARFGETPATPVAETKASAPKADEGKVATARGGAASDTPAKPTALSTYPTPQVKRTLAQRRDDLIGAIMRVTGGRGIHPNMAMTLSGDKANNVTKLRGLFTAEGQQDMDDLAMLLREPDEGYDVADGNALSEMIREAASGNVTKSMRRSVQDKEDAKEKQHRDRIRQLANKYGVKTAFIQFSAIEQEVYRRMEQRHTDAVQKLDERSRTRYDAMLKNALTVVDNVEVDAILRNLHNRFSGREFYTAAIKPLRVYINDVMIERANNAAEIEANSINDAVEGAEPDWLADGPEGPGIGSDPAATPEAAYGQQKEEVAPILDLAGQTPAEVRAQEAKRKADEEAAKKTEVDKAADDFQLGQAAPNPVDKKVTTEDAIGQGDLLGAKPAKNMEQYTKVAADSIGQLRKVDVFRVLVESNRKEIQKDLAAYIKVERPDLAAEVDNVLAEEGKQPAAEKPQSEPAPATFSRAQSLESRIALADLTAIKDAFSTQFPGASVVVVERESQLPDQLQEEITAADANDEVAGAFHKGIIYLVRDNLRDVGHAQDTILHEAEHAGLSKLFGDSINQVLLDIGRSNLRTQIEAKKIREKYGYSHARSIEEVLAEMGPKAKSLKAWPQLVAFVRAKLRKLGYVKEWTNNDVDALVLRALANLKKGGKTNIYSGSALSRAFDGPEVAKTPIGDTKEIEVDGVMRSALNSNGKPIQDGANIPGMADKDTVAGKQAPTSTGDGDTGIAMPPLAEGFVRLYSGSHDLIRTIRNDGLFGGVFASEEKEVADSHGIGKARVTHYMDVEEDAIASNRDLDTDETETILRDSLALFSDEEYDDIYRAVVNDRGVYNLDIADDRILEIFWASDMAEADWEAQRVRGVLAKSFGFQAVEMTDEHGGSYLVLPGAAITPVSKPTTSASPDGSNARFSRTGAIANQPINQSWQAPDNLGKWDDFVRTMQDKMIDTRRVITAVREAGIAIADAIDPYLQEVLYHGRSAKRVSDFSKQELRPLLVEMGMRKIDRQDLEDYLWARHAAERNAQIAKINPVMPDAGSGLTDQQAADILAGQVVNVGGRDIQIDMAQMTGFRSLAAKVDAITKETTDTLVRYGLETQETVEAWRATYGNYVPLMRDMESDDNYSGAFGLGLGTGQGFSVRGSASKRAMGSDRGVIDILANIAMQRERAIVRGEKNRVAQAMYGLSVAAPNPDFWLPLNPDAKKSPAEVTAELVNLGLNPIDAANIANEPKQQYVDPKTGMVMERINPQLRTRGDVLAVRIDGKDRYVMFSSNERAQKMVAGLKNLDVEQLGMVMQKVAVVTRWFAAINTQYNPVFGITNGLRDLGTGMLNLTSTELKGRQSEVMKNTFSALRGIYSDLRAQREGRAPTSAWSLEFEEFAQEGGQTGYRDMFQTSDARTEDLMQELKSATLGKTAFSFNDDRNPLLGWLSDYNTAIENAIRLSAYKAGKDKGMTKAQAASLAKNLTVNFNKKGLAATQLGAIYAFFNAAAQGTARIGQTMVKIENGKPSLTSAGKKIFYGGMMAGVMQAVMFAMAGYDDEEPPQFIREKNFIIPLPDGKYLSVPYPLGFHVIPNIGRVSAEFALGGFKNPGKRMVDMFSMILDGFNPIGGSSGGVTQMISPTVTDPLVALSENKDWTGKSIFKEDFNKMHPTAGWTRKKDTASALSRSLAFGINYITGGGQYEIGLLSPTPDQLDYLIGQATGGVGRESLKTWQAGSTTLTGESLPMYKIPVAGRFVGETTGQASESSKFYNNLRRIGEHKAALEEMQKQRDLPAIIQFRKDNPDAIYVKQADRAASDISALKRRKRDLLEKDAAPEQIKLMDAMITTRVKRYNEQLSVKE